MEKNISNDPIELFNEWLDLAKESEINDPDAMALATSTKDGKPSVRMVLLKEANEKGFKFHTNSESQKGNELDDNPFAALCFHWKTLRKQIRIEGSVEKVSKEEADEYFKNRPYPRKIGAHASDQSRPLESREYLEEKLEALRQKYPEISEIPRPEYWNGYRVIPNKIEFWWDNSDRLHDRIVFTKDAQGKWQTQRLYP